MQLEETFEQLFAGSVIHDFPILKTFISDSTQTQFRVQLIFEQKYQVHQGDATSPEP